MHGAYHLHKAMRDEEYLPLYVLFINIYNSFYNSVFKIYLKWNFQVSFYALERKTIFAPYDILFDSIHEKK